MAPATAPRPQIRSAAPAAPLPLPGDRRGVALERTVRPARVGSQASSKRTGRGHRPSPPSKASIRECLALSLLSLSPCLSLSLLSLLSRPGPPVLAPPPSVCGRLIRIAGVVSVDRIVYRSWHWEDAPSMSPTDGFARGAVSLGAEVRQWMSWIVGNVTKAHPHALPRPRGSTTAAAATRVMEN